MKMFQAALALAFGMLTVPAIVPAYAEAAPAAIPKGCEPYTGAYAEKDGLKCTVTGGVTSGAGEGWGQWQTLIATAPPGYTLRYSWGRVWADNPVGDHERHRCGVRDEGGNLPYDPPSPIDPKSHLRTGEAHYAQCVITERDAHHVVMQFNLQGVKAKDNIGLGNQGPANPDVSLSGTAQITAYYVPVSAR
jgi:hypothetical protein